MTHLTVKKKNEVYITIHSDEEYVHRELADYFTFEVPEAKFLKKESQIQILGWNHTSILPCYRRFVSWVVRSSTGMGSRETIYCRV